MTQKRAYFVAAAVLIALAIVAGAVLTLSGMDRDQVGQFVTGVLGVAALVMALYRDERPTT
jgi:hypothetical protein